MTNAELKRILNYDPASGIFTWKISPSRSVKAGSLAGAVTADGYVTITIKYKQYMAHILAYFYMNGLFPPSILDHKDRNKLNNSISNLRLATASTNSMNRNVSYTNKSGYKGICWHKTKKRWMCYIYLNRKFYNLGYYNSIELAYLVREAAEIELFGEFSILR